MTPGGKALSLRAGGSWAGASRIGPSSFPVVRGSLRPGAGAGVDAGHHPGERAVEVSVPDAGQVGVGRMGSGERADSSLRQVWKVSRGGHEIVVVVQDHESADGCASADQQIYAGQRSMRSGA
jgi:hypothetical protein